ncbi:MAG TPA: HAD-IC family P-type ATPase [Polyangiaceae bacterium]
MAFRETLASTLQLFGRRRRKTWFGPTRAQLELRELDDDELLVVDVAVRKTIGALDGVEWVEINPYTRRVVVAYRAGRVNETLILEALERAEHDACCAAASFGRRPQPHPCDEERLLRLSVELTADAVGLLVGTALRLSPFPASRIAGTLASVSVIAKGAPRIRKPLDNRLGAERTDLLMSLAIAAGNGMAQRPIASLVDVAHRTALLREARAQHGVWQEREEELCSHPCGAHRSVVSSERPVELPPGPIEEYANRAWVVALAGFSFSLLTTRSFHRATAALFGGVPKPARLGRDVFSAEVGRALAQRRVLVLDPDALRRLDRLDCLVLAADVVPQDRFAITALHVSAGNDVEAARVAIDHLFDVDHPLERRNEGELYLSPLGLTEAPEDALTSVATELSIAGNLVLELRDSARRIAVASVELLPQTGLEELVSAAQRADMHVVVAGDSDVLERAPVDDRVDAARDLVEIVRHLQQQGRGVAVVARSNSDALSASDCGIGLFRAGEQAPWGAHVLCRDDLSDVSFLIEATVVARQIAKQSVNIALAAATMGALVSAGGILPLTTRRVVTVVNAATLISMLNGVRASRALIRQPIVPLRDRTPWHALDARGVMRRLGTSEVGLTLAEVQRRSLVGKIHSKTSLVELAEDVSDELFNPLAPLLAAGAGLSAVAGSLGDAVMVGGVVVINAFFSGYQKFRTERRIRDLTQVARRTATVHREGHITDIDAEQLVCGDVIVLTSGEVVPADCRILHAESLEVDTASLTGESLPVVRSAEPSFEISTADRSCMLYAGTSIAAGRVTAIVVAVADQTEARRGTSALRRVPHASGVEQRLRSLVNLTAPVALGAGAGLVLAGVLRGRRVEHLVPAGVSLAVASVPEGLPLLATAAQLAAARRLMARGALVRNTRSIEALGRVDVLCLDKTGTLTEGRLDFVGVTQGTRFVGRDELLDNERMVLAAALRAAPDGRYVLTHDDPTDVALMRAAEAQGVSLGFHRNGWERRAELPFEPGRAYHAVIGAIAVSSNEARNDETPDESRMAIWLDVKGAPETILSAATAAIVDGALLPLDDALRRDIERTVDQLARRGYRLIAVAERQLTCADPEQLRSLSGLTLLGTVAFRDPVRPTAAKALRRLRRTGVRPLMITGDHPRTAAAIAEELAFLHPRAQLTGAQLLAMTDDELDNCLDDVQIFARVTPSQKARIVRSLQRKGHVVAMVGDGANDAPAIRLAQVGIAVGEQSTGAARSAADIVLTDERVETIVEAVIEGRAMWASVRDAVSILVGGNLGEIGFTLGAGLVDGRPPLNPRQLLLVNLLTDVAPAMAIALRPPSVEKLEALASEGPDASLGKPLNRDIAARAIVTASGAGMAWTVARVFGSAERASTVGLLALVGTQLGQTITSGGYSRPVLTTSILSSALLFGIVQTPGVSQFFGCQPLTPIGWGMALGSSVLATGLAVSFPQVTSIVAQRLRPIDNVLHEPPKSIPTSVPPPPTMRAVQSVIQNEALLELVHRTGE